LVSGRTSRADADALRAVLADTGADLMLHGHSHEGSLAAVRGPKGPIPVLGAASASTPAGGRHSAAGWNEIAITRDGEGFRAEVAVRGVVGDLHVETLGRYGLA
ncbi:MAG TPA: metallophosphoesterase, partial [Phenylobacterium sp.]